MSILHRTFVLTQVVSNIMATKKVKKTESESPIVYMEDKELSDRVWNLYSSFLEKRFTPEQSFELTKIVMEKIMVQS
jgi:hypothetical protein